MKLSRWPLWVVMPLALLTITPLVVVAASWALREPEIWQHLRDYVLARVLLNTLILTVFVGLGVALLGVSLAWITVMCEFPGRRWLGGALMVPLALPSGPFSPNPSPPPENQKLWSPCWGSPMKRFKASSLTGESVDVPD